MNETLANDNRVRFVPIAAPKPDPAAIESELAAADRDLAVVEQAFTEMNLQKARSVTDTAIAVYEKNIVALAQRPNGTMPLRNAWVKAARVRFFDGDEAGAREAVKRAMALDPRLAFTTELFPVPMKNLVTEVHKQATTAGHGKVTLESQPLGAAVFLNGKPLPNPTPTEATGVAPGPNYVRFEKAGFQPYTATVNVAGAASGSYSSATLSAAGGKLPGAVDANRAAIDDAKHQGALPGVGAATSELGLDLCEIVRIERLQKTDGPPLRIIAYTYSAKLDRVLKRVDRRVNENELEAQGRLTARELLSGGVLDPGGPPKEVAKPSKPGKEPRPGREPKPKKDPAPQVVYDRRHSDDKIAGLDKPVFWAIIGASAAVVLIGVGVGLGVGLTARNGWIAQQNTSIARIALTF